MKAATLNLVKAAHWNVISNHAAREGGDCPNRQRLHAATEFQSTPPVKAATDLLRQDDELREFQSTPPVKAATDSRQFAFTNFVFQSTPPVKAATPVFVSVSECLSISIHAAREGGDHNS